jgi:hypothetical protein
MARRWPCHGSSGILGPMRRLLILFVMVHLLMDLAIPSAGAFRFNPDESLVGLRVQHVRGQEIDRAPQAEPLRAAVESPRPSVPVSLDPAGVGSVPDFIRLLPRRNPWGDRSPKNPTEPA